MGKTQNNQEIARQLTLALAYLTSWEEGVVENREITRAWKGYDWSVLDELKRDELIDYSYKAKSLYITEKGAAKAKEIIEKLFEIL